MSTFKAESRGQVNYVKCPFTIEPNDSKQLEIFMKGWLDLPTQLHVFDFKETKALSASVYRNFVAFQQQLKAAKKMVASVNLNKDLLRQVTDDGVSTAFGPAQSIDAALAKAGIKSKQAGPALNVEFINPFVKAALETLRIQAKLESTPGKPHLKQEGEEANVGIAGIISLNSDQFNGSIALCFPKKVFLAVYEGMLGEKKDEITAEIQDAAGELLNIIFGMAKADLNNNKGYTIQKAIPTVLSGEGMKVRHISTTPPLVLPFETAHGPFHIEISKDQAT